MKLLIDENLPKRLKLDFPQHEIFTVSDMRWNSKKNGELLKLMLEQEFEVLLTFDRNLQYQQNFAKYPISVFVLNAEDNTYLTLSPLIPIIHQHLYLNLKPGPTAINV
jgi:predicted nuclease of predicted toxin-antitoxin system